MRVAKRPFARTTWWGAAATAVATAAVLCAPATETTQVLAGSGVSERVAAQFASANSNFSCFDWGSAKADRISRDALGRYQSVLDPGSLFTVENAIGARGLWSTKDASGRSLTGQGVGIALLDSGVDQVAGLSGAGKVTYGPDLSIEGNGVLTHKDTYGHGTFMAGIIAGRGSTVLSSDLFNAQPNVQLGVAPDAKLLALKLATTDGSTDVSQVIASLDWVTQHPVMPDGTRVRVINLSYGTSSSQSYLADPLAAAAENAWRHGIVVVTSAGNGGSADGRLNDPAIDPYVIAVGATDNNLNVSQWSGSKAQVAAFSQVGSPTRHVDLVAPGTSLISLRAPGSFIDVNNPSGLVAGDVTGTLFRGSGTSQAAAVVSGSVALLLQAFPNMTPDQVKYALTSSSNPIVGASTVAAGAGTLSLIRALTVLATGTVPALAPTTTPMGQTAAVQTYPTSSVQVSTQTSARSSVQTSTQTSGMPMGPGPTQTLPKTSAGPKTVQTFPQSTGNGSINAARGGSSLVDAAGIDLIGEIDVQGTPWKPAAWWKATSSLSSWSGGKWLGVTWTGDNWQPVARGLTASRWSSARWSSSRWSTADWSSSRWSASRWSASRWSASRWSSLFWT